MFYPVIPLLALLALLWVRPRGEIHEDTELPRLSPISAFIGNSRRPAMKHSESKEIKYQQMDFFVTITHGINGSFKSTLLLIFQVSIINTYSL